MSKHQQSTFHSEQQKISAYQNIDSLLSKSHKTYQNYQNNFDTIFGDEDIPHHIETPRKVQLLKNSLQLDSNTNLTSILDNLMTYGILPGMDLPKSQDSSQMFFKQTRQKSYDQYEKALNSVPYCDDLYKTEILDKTETEKDDFFRVKLNFTEKLTWNDVKSDSNWEKLSQGGCYTPKHCISRQRLVVIIPYRDRINHLWILLRHLHPFLQAQHRDYCIVLSEQSDSGRFNRAKLMNTGFLESRKHEHFKNRSLVPDCFVFQDVDLIPEDLRLLYGCFRNRSIHLCDKVDKFEYVTQYAAGFTFSSGGAVAIHRDQYELVNGHPNSIFGWGGEDHEMASRLRYSDFEISNIRENLDLMDEYILRTTVHGEHKIENARLRRERENIAGGEGFVRAEGFGRYSMVKHNYGYSNGRGKVELDLRQGSRTGLGIGMYGNWKRSFDGLNTTVYNLVRTQLHFGYTKYTFEIRPAVVRDISIKTLRTGLNSTEKQIIFESYQNQTQPCKFVKLRETTGVR